MLFRSERAAERAVEIGELGSDLARRKRRVRQFTDRLGLSDAFRLFDQPERSYTWWDYRMMAFRRKMGLRIDHILLSPSLAPKCTACSIDTEPRKRERPSDHAPVIAQLTL